MKLTSQVRNDRVDFSDEQGHEWFSLSFERTLRIPDNAGKSNLPPSLGHFPIKRVEDYPNVPSEWKKTGGVFIPMFQREAMWINFGYVNPNNPVAVKVGIGKINAVSGNEWSDSLLKNNQDYMVCPPQQWLDGINSGKDTIRQFIAMPLGSGYTVESQMRGEDKFGGMQIAVYPPKRGWTTPVLDARRSHSANMAWGDLEVFTLNSNNDFKPKSMSAMYSSTPQAAMSGARGQSASMDSASEMGMAAGGKMVQKIYEDEHGFEFWDQNREARFFVHLVNPEMYYQITGERLTYSPVTRQTYNTYGYTWFKVWDDELSDVEAPQSLKDVQSVGQIDSPHLTTTGTISSNGYPKVVPTKPNAVSDGNW